MIKQGVTRKIELTPELTAFATDQPVILRNATCPYCGVLITPELDSEDHVVARRLVPKGMLAGSWNLQLRACQPCNNKKSDLEDDISAITMQPDLLGRHAHDHPMLRSESERKAKGSRSRRTGKPVAESVEQITIEGSPWAGVKFTFNFSAPPQAETERVFELSRLQLMAFFYWLTYDEASRRGAFWRGPFCPLLEAFQADWGNPVHESFMRAVVGWEPRLLCTNIADGFFKIAIRKHPSAACWSWALEWNHKLRVVGLFGDLEVARDVVGGFSRLDLQEIPVEGGDRLAVKIDTPLKDEDDLLFIYQPVEPPTGSDDDGSGEGAA